jgi:hypothetical protein
MVADASLAGDPGAAIAARVAEVFADRDAERRAQLERWLSAARCRGCGKRLHERSAARRPGACGRCARGRPERGWGGGR